jgi:alkanesulfonate monooxygenase SsuD/methylene tetrahydromethanopterin reductase-like flavin-dependent oxidoreductase (luciferase family)
VKLGAQFVRLGGDDGEAADPLARRRAPSFPLWEQPVVDHEDSDHRVDRAGILPRPKRQIPIWLGGSSEAAFDRAARIGDGFLFSGRTQTEAVQIKALSPSLRSHVLRTRSRPPFPPLGENVSALTGALRENSPFSVK